MSATRGGIDRRQTFPELLRLGPQIRGLGEPDGNEGSTDGSGNKETEEGATENLPPHAANEALPAEGDILGAGELGLVGETVCRVLVGIFEGGGDSKGLFVVGNLLDETEENRDDDGGLEGLTEDDEEDGD